VNLFDFSDLEALVVDVVAWTLLGLGFGYVANRVPEAWLACDRGLLRLAGFEAGGRWYERRLRIKRWKDLLPDAGAVFAGGRRKAGLVRPDRRALAALAVETRRAELVHAALLLTAPLFVLWNPWDLAAVMVVYAVVANVPCLLVQRYNRARLVAVLDGR